MHRGVLAAVVGLVGAIATKRVCALSVSHPPVEECHLTSFNSRKGYHPHPKHKLTDSNNRKSDGNGKVFQRHGVNPVTTFTGINQEIPDKKVVPNLMVKTTCARRVQATNMTREYHEVFSHLYSCKCEKSDDIRDLLAHLRYNRHQTPAVSGSLMWANQIKLTFVSSCDRELYATVFGGK